MKSNLLSLFFFSLVFLIPFTSISQTCPVPASLTTTSVSSSSAILMWTGPAGSTSYIVQYHAPNGAWVNVTTQASSLTLTNLVCGTTYEWHVAAYCNNGTNVPGAYSTGATFTTLPCTTNCIAPSGLTNGNTGTNSATFSWNPTAGAVAYLLQYHTANGAWINVTSPTSSITLTTLTCGTTYEWHVATICNTTAGGTSVFSNSISFTTTACTPPACDPPGGLVAGSITATGATLEWTAPAGAFAYIVQYHAPNGAWVNVTTQANHITLTNLSCGTVYEWHVAAYCNNNTANPSAYSTTIAFTTLACTPVCLTPTGPITSNVNATGATFSWTAVTGALGYVVQYHPLIPTGSPWTSVNVTATSLTLTNLVCGTAYEWHVATLCSTATGGTSVYTTPLSFTTSACTTPCTAPTGLAVGNITTTGATLEWTGPTGAFLYIVQYHAPNGAWVNVTSQTNHIPLTGLTCGTTYEWHVAAYCGNNTSTPSPYSTTGSFTTAPCTTNCVAPTGPITSNVNVTGATFSWMAVTGALGYVVQYHPLSPAGSPWINVNATATSLTLTNLVCGTAYEWHVATLCNTATGTISAYTTPLSFTTTACTTPCTAPTGLAAGSITTTGATLEWTGPAGAFLYTVQYHAPNGAWVTVSAQINHITLTGLTCGTTYEWHVAAYCGNNTSTPGPYSVASSFTTAPCTTNCISPTGLTTGNIGTNVATFEWNAVVGAIGYIVQYHSPNGAWVNVTAQANHVTLTNLTCGTTYEWHVATICGTPTGNTSPYSAGVTFTTLACTPPSCPVPTGLTTANIGTTVATLQWVAPTSGAASYIVQYHSANGAWITVSAQSNHLTLTTLNCGTTYEWHVASICNNNGTTVQGPYSTAISFTTSPCSSNCATPVGLITSNIGTNAATLSWAPSIGAIAYIVQYHSPNAGWINVTTQTPSVTLTTLACNAVYEWHVAAVCGTAATNISPYSTALAFTTLLCTTNVCPVPGGLTSAAVTSTGGSRMLTWNPTNALSYNIRYRIVGSPTWLTTTSATNSKLITGLQSTSHYEWQVQAVCATASGAAIVSAWSAPALFDTPTSRMLYPNPASGRMIQVPVATQNEQRVTVIISDHLGKTITTVDKMMAPGGGVVDIDIANLSTGIYFVRIKGGGANEVQKLIVAK